MASVWYKKAGELFGAGTLDIAGDDLRALIVTDAHTPDFVNDEFVSAVTAEEVSGSTRIISLAGVTWTYNAGVTPDQWEFKHTGGNFGSPGAGPTVGAVIIYKFITNDAASPLLVYDDLLANKPTTGDQVDYTPPSNGHVMRHVAVG